MFLTHIARQFAVLFFVHKNSNFTHSKVMVLWVILAIEFVLLLMILPFKISAKIQFSLDRQCCIVAIKLMSKQVAVVRLFVEKERIRISVNGRIISFNKMNNKSHRCDYRGVAKLMTSVKGALLLGTDEAATSACICSATIGVIDGVLSNLNEAVSVELNSYPCFDKEMLVFYGDVIFKLAIIDVIELMLAYGIGRNFKTNN